MLGCQGKLDYSTLDLKRYQGQPSYFGCHQNTSGVKVTKLDYNIEEKNVEKQTKRPEI